jgi:potassium efflux system protein
VSRSTLRVALSVCLMVLLSGWPSPSASQGKAQGRPVEAPEANLVSGAVASPEHLPKLLAAKAQLAEQNLAALEAQLPGAREDLARAEKNLRGLRVAVASLKATLALQKLPGPRVEELLGSYTRWQTHVGSRFKNLTKDLKELEKDQVEEALSQSVLAEQITVLQAVQPLPVWLPEVLEAYGNYLNLANRRHHQAAQVMLNWPASLHVVEQQKELLAGLEPQIKALEEAWKATLLERRVHLSIWQQLARIWETLEGVPGRVWAWLENLVQSGQLSGFLLDHLAPLLGLLVLIVLLSWGVRRLKRQALSQFRTWQKQVQNPGLASLLVLGDGLAASLSFLCLIFWVALLFWSFGLLTTTPALLILNTLAVLLGLRIALTLAQAWFAGKERGGLLSLGPRTARFYRHSMKLFLAYLLIFGAWLLPCAGLLDFSVPSRFFLGYLFRIGFLAWVVWLLRRRYLTYLLPELPGPAWVRRLAVMRLLKGLALLLLAIIILADLLGFHNLALYVAQASAWTGFALVIYWVLWVAADSLLYYLLHPEAGWATRLYPEQRELVQKLYGSLQWLAAILLAAGVILLCLYIWGLNPGDLAPAFAWMSWGPAVGPAKLSTLNMVGAIVAIYLGVGLSRLIRSALLMRVFPRTGWDAGVQYTISTTVHYVVLILAILIAMNILGFPLTNLALVAGALGVGIGFGLQNIVNNFISGLILLFERPIKVGDMLVVDGQWGLVKEIRVRSTIFETFDRYVLIIPNSELVSSKVLNWTHYGRGINRLTLKVGVGYGSDVRQVTRLINEICATNPRVLSEPAPQIYFSAYGESSLDFTIWVHLRTPNDRIPATHELNSAMFEAFRQAGVEVPFPQRDLFIKNWPSGLGQVEDEKEQK